MHPPIVDQNRLLYADAEGFIAGLPPDLQAAARLLNAPIALSADAYFDALTALYNAHHDPQQHRVHIQVSPAGGQWCSDALIIRAAEWAKAHQTRVQMHLLETVYQRTYAHKQFGKSFPRHLAALGVLDKRLTLAHMVWVDKDDFDLIADSGAGIAHNASSNLRLMSGIAPVAQLLNAGMRLGVGMDGHTLDDDQDYLREMRLAWTLANRPGVGSARVSPETIIELGTSGGAAITFGAGVPLGKLQAGCLADLVLIDWQAVLGLYAPNGGLHADEIAPLFLRRAQRQHVRHVMVNGVWVVQDGRHLHLDEQAIAEAMRAEVAIQTRNTAAPPLATAVRQFYQGWDG
jgi:cytosine/adenosine deaminase-related metal-dependent hydrolase